MNKIERPQVSVSEQAESEKAQIKELNDFNMKYFQELEGEDGWIAIGMDNCKNQKYFTAVDSKGEKLGIVGVYDTDDDQNITHTIVDPEFRGQGLATQFKDHLMENLDLPYITLIIDIDNEASLSAAEKLPGIKRVSDKNYEQEFHKVKFIYKKPEPKETLPEIKNETSKLNEISEQRFSSEEIKQIQKQEKEDGIEIAEIRNSLESR